MERVENLQRSFYAVSRRVDGLSTAQQLLTSRCDDLERKFATCVNTPRSSATDAAPKGMISSISRRLQRLEEVNWHHELAVTGLPDFPNTDTMEVISSIATAINVPFANADVAAATCIDSKKSKSKTLIVRFTSAIIRDSWLNKKRTKKDLKAIEVFPNWPETMIYINERSSAEERRIFMEAKQFAKIHNFKYVWMRRGITYVRKDSTSKATRFFLPQAPQVGNEPPSPAGSSAGTSVPTSSVSRVSLSTVN